MKKKNGLTETKLFHFHRIFKYGGHRGGSLEPPEPPLDPPLSMPTDTGEFVLNYDLLTSVQYLIC